jgi:LysM repeat protein
LIHPVNQKENISMNQPTQPVTQTSQPQPAAPAQKEHVAVAGESIEQIARNYGVSAKHVRQLNKLSGPVQPGQKLRIPVARAVAASATTIPPKALVAAQPKS